MLPPSLYEPCGWSVGKSEGPGAPQVSDPQGREPQDISFSSDHSMKDPHPPQPNSQPPPHSMSPQVPAIP